MGCRGKYAVGQRAVGRTQGLTVSGLYIGLMSGTSLDGVDAVLVDFDAPQAARVLGHASAPLPAPLRAELLALNAPTDNELHRAALAANGLVRLYAEQVHTLLQQCGVEAAAVSAIGAHGQTVRHRPQEFDGTGYTLQLNNPSLLAELCGITVVADFRSRDVAAGGQGAPLVPPFHQAFFGHIAPQVGVLNIGGISNITLVGCQPDKPLLGFDCGPGNALMDTWCQQHTGASFDRDGAWAAGGTLITPMLLRMLREPFFQRKPPKSTGRDLFNAPWLQSQLRGFEANAAQDIQATLTELTAQSCARSIETSASNLNTLIVCGGGALNLHLMHRITALVPQCQVHTSDHYALPPLQVEATAFAWLAKQALERRPGSVPDVTGAKGPRILGALYCAG